jgi:uncharacterized membrane-anchored protein
MKNKKRLALFTVIAVIQLSVVLYMAWQWENILQTGQRFEWETAPVDPYDAFKGRYIDLSFKERSGPIVDSASFTYGQKAYAIIEKNADGKAFISGVSAKQPAGKPYVNVTATYVDKGKVHVQLPFRRYYLPEHLAAPAETAYRGSAGKTGVAAIRLKDGYGVVEELYIDGKTLDQFLQDALSRK